ncbi:uncharacterized protein LOC111906035 [Lactuca sativa]|uniref:uncharacterized protein LOC111906035 n=1 Tax=Lactuca sativa TaxID=4236 RepID=UPI000CD8DEC9|nr:uncharacterized protein LOC111906035 [Lactuca sativa]
MIRERTLPVSQYVADEEIKKAWYHEMLRSDIRQFVSRSSCKMLEDMISRARKWEIDLEMEKKRKYEYVSIVEGSGKRPEVSDSRPRGHQGCNCCGRCGKMHEGACIVGGSGCFKCGWTGHINRDCTTTTTTTPVFDLICFHCDQMGHKKTHCLSLAAAGPVSARAPATLWITHGLQGQADMPVAKRKAFKATTDEAHAALGVVTGYLIVCIACAEQEVCRSSRGGELYCPLDVEIVDDKTIQIARVHLGCALQLFLEQYMVDLVPIMLRGNNVIMGMEWRQ